MYTEPPNSQYLNKADLLACPSLNNKIFLLIFFKPSEDKNLIQYPIPRELI